MSIIDDYKSINVSDLRKEAEERLQWCYAHNHISIETLEQRLEELHKTEDKIKIIAFVQDLPFPAPEKEDGSTHGAEFHSKTGLKAESYFSLLGSNMRKGRWDVPSEIVVTAILGSQELDFTEALFPGETVKIKAFCLLGSIELKLPKAVQLKTGGIPILASIENKVDSHGSGPRIEVDGFALLGSISAFCPKEKKKRKKSV